MNKRSGNFDKSGGSLNHKKPKLNISIQRRNEINNGQSTSAAAAASATSNSSQFQSQKQNFIKLKPFAIKKDDAVFRIPNVPPAPVPAAINFWEDDDDDDLLLVSQIVEKQIHNNKTNSVDLRLSDSISFENFERNVQSSTQFPPKGLITEKESISLFDDDDFINLLDDNDFDNIPKKSNENLKRPSISNQRNEDFKRPSPVPKLMSMNNDYGRASKTNSNSDIEQDAMKVDKLFEQVDVLRNEKKKLDEQINGLNEKLQTKDGETSTLRHELRTSKQTIDTLRKQKINENDEIRKEYQNKIMELERSNNTAQAQLNSKRVEIMQLKQRIATGGAAEHRRNFQDLSEVLKLNFRIPSKPENNFKFKILSEIFFKQNLKVSTYVDSYYQSQLDILCSILAEIQIEDINDNNLNRIYSTTMLVFSQGFTELQKYFNNLKFSKNQNNNSNTVRRFLTSTKSIDDDLEYKDFVECKTHSKSIKTIFKTTELFAFEKLIAVRRFIAAYCLIIRIISAKQLQINFSNKENDNNKIVIENSIELLKDSSEFSNHMGIIESYAYYMTSLAKINKIEDNLKLIKDLILCIPNIRVLTELSDCLKEISNDSNLINLLCEKSEKFKISQIPLENKKIVKIRNPNFSCILQAFGTVLEFKLKQNEKNVKEFKNEIYRLVKSHTKLLSNCFVFYPHFLTPNKSEGSETNSTIESTTLSLNKNGCHCCVIICSSFVNVFYLFLKIWIENQNEFDIVDIKKIVKLGLKLLCDIFVVHPQKIYIYDNVVVRQLFAISEWLDVHKDKFNIKNASVLIEGIRKSSILDDSQFKCKIKTIDEFYGMECLNEVFKKSLFL